MASIKSKIVSSLLAGLSEAFALHTWFCSRSAQCFEEAWLNRLGYGDTVPEPQKLNVLHLRLVLLSPLAVPAPRLSPLSGQAAG